jgi:hypothetical protein
MLSVRSLTKVERRSVDGVFFDRFEEMRLILCPPRSVGQTVAGAGVLAASASAAAGCLLNTRT